MTNVANKSRSGLLNTDHAGGKVSGMIFDLKKATATQLRFTPRSAMKFNVKFETKLILQTDKKTNVGQDGIKFEQEEL